MHPHQKEPRKNHGHKKATAKVLHEPPKHWIIALGPDKVHVYKKSDKGIERIPDANECCSHPCPEPSGAKDDFFLHLATWLDHAEREHSFDRLVLIGSTATLDDIHGRLSENVHDRICAALESEIAEIEEDEIEDHLTEVVWL